MAPSPPAVAVGEAVGEPVAVPEGEGELVAVGLGIEDAKRDESTERELVPLEETVGEAGEETLVAADEVGEPLALELTVILGEALAEGDGVIVPAERAAISAVLSERW